MQRFSLIHPRCGTAFLLWVMVIGIFVFAFVGQPAWYWLIVSRILLLPVIAGIAYELIRFAGKHQDNRVLMTLLAPGLWLQRLTTREPSLDQIEVSIRALQEVLRREGRLTTRGAQGRGHGLVPRIVREAEVDLGRARSRAAPGVVDGVELRRVRAAVTLAVARRRARGQDEPGGAARRRARCLLRHVARGRARAGRRDAAERLDVRCTITMDEVEGEGPPHRRLRDRARRAASTGSTRQAFERAVQTADEGCPFSALIAGERSRYGARSAARASDRSERDGGRAPRGRDLAGQT